MGTIEPNERQWLQAEQNGEDDLAEAVFARLIAGLPVVEPNAGFVDRTVQAAWLARSRRRRVIRCSRIAAALLIGIASLGSIYEFGVLAVGPIARGITMFSDGLVWLLMLTTEGASWWWIADRIGATVGDIIDVPRVVATLAACELIAVLATYAFQQLLREDWLRHK